MEQKKKLSSGRWLVMFAGCLLLILVLVMVLNVVVDPYGAFGDRVLQWWSYDETLNPRMAKISYLEQHHDQYDSYIVGSSGSSSYPVDALDEYLDASFYNCFFYGTNMDAYEEICDYLIDNYTVKNLLLNLSPKIAIGGESPAKDRTNCQYYKVSGENPLVFYSRYLLANPMDSIEKLQKRSTDGYLTETYKVFDEETGAYDKRSRDAEQIGALDEYLSRDAYSIFNDYPENSLQLNGLDEAMESVERIVEKCRENGVNLIVTCQPAYYAAAEYYSEADQAAFRNALAQVTDYWDFTLSSVSYEPRYFYDETHFRNGVGYMALARIFDDSSVYVPEDFGEYISQGSTPGAPQGEPADASDYTAQVPILLYHHLVEENAETKDAITVDRFAEQMQALSDAGYTPVSMDDLRSYVWEGTDLPDKPVVITFDDGYESNYRYAYPILQQYGFQATIYAIGVSVGKDTYKDTGVAMTPHFSLEEGAEMTASGLVTLASHGYNLHEVSGRDTEPLRAGAIQLEGETESEFVAYLQEDCAEQATLTGIRTDIFSYPYGACSELSEVVLADQGVWSTVTLAARTNTLVRGLGNCLHQLGRYYATEDLSGDDLIAMISGG